MSLTRFFEVPDPQKLKSSRKDFWSVVAIQSLLRKKKKNTLLRRLCLSFLPSFWQKTTTEQVNTLRRLCLSSPSFPLRRFCLSFIPSCSSKGRTTYILCILPDRFFCMSCCHSFHYSKKTTTTTTTKSKTVPDGFLLVCPAIPSVHSFIDEDTTIVLYCYKQLV